MDTDTQAPVVRGYWCRGCGMVRFDLLRPLCRHGVPDPTGPVQVMDDLPSWHPLARHPEDEA